MFYNPHIVKVVGSSFRRRRQFIALERCHGPDLYAFLQSRPRISEWNVAVFARMLLLAPADMHRQGVVHRDVKPDNVLLDMDANWERVVKLGDFGAACRVRDGMTELCGTATYVSPQMRTRQPYGPKTDMWSLGILLFELLCWRPLDGPNDPILRHLHGGACPPSGGCWEGVSSEAKHLVCGLLQVREEDRLSAADSLEHPWLMGGGCEVTAGRRPSIAAGVA
jgi:serine/threonine protein kinase